MTEARGVSLGPSPLRRSYSLRRTTSVQSVFVEGQTDAYRMIGKARDMFTGNIEDAPSILDEASVLADLSRTAGIKRIEASRCLNAVAAFAGLQPGGPLRKAMAASLLTEADQSSLLHRLLDDLGGASFMAGTALVSWTEGESHEAAQQAYAGLQGRDITDVCLSYAAGTRTLLPDGRPNTALINPAAGRMTMNTADPLGWHGLAPTDGPNHCRIRRMDLWDEAGLLHMTAGFQDSAALSLRGDERRIFHEYRVDARIERKGYRLADITVEPGILPFDECLAAPATARKLIGQPVSTFRQLVLAALPGAAGCTHLNDVLRAMQDMVAMLPMLDRITE